MKSFFQNLLNALLILLWAGGIVCGLVLAIKAQSVAASLSIVVLGVLGFPTIKKIVQKMNDL